MTNHSINHDYTQSNNLQVVMQQLTEASEFELVEQIFALSDRPEVLGLLVYKLTNERKKTNELISDLNKKYEEIVKILMNKEMGRVEAQLQTESSMKSSFIEQAQQKKDIEKLFLTEQDKSILRMAKSKDWVSAKEIKEAVNYKGLNAASQRLNKLEKQGYLQKQRVGQQVVFILNNLYRE